MADKLVEIQFEKAKLKRIEQMLKGIPGALPKVISRGINRTATMSRTEIVNQISANLSLKKKVIRDRLRLEKATYQKWQARITVRTKRIPLMEFKARQNKKGVSYLIEKGQGRKRIDSAFEATMASGHRGIFKRKGPSRFPIIELLGPSLGQVFAGAERITAEVQSRAGQMLEKNIDDQIKLLLARRGVA